MAVPGLTPKPPNTRVGPVFVTAWPPNTAKLCAVPSEGATWAKAATDENVHRSAVSKTVKACLAVKAVAILR